MGYVISLKVSIKNSKFSNHYYVTIFVISH